MEIHMRQIHPSINHGELSNELATILHSDNFKMLSTTPLNFHLQLLKDSQGMRAHIGSGFLTLPTAEAGEAFFSLYGDGPNSSLPRTPIFLRNKQIRFSRSRRPIRLPVLKSILNYPYKSPEEVTAERNHTHSTMPTNKQSVLVDSIQFGWLCRDYDTSVEWEKNVTGACYLAFQNDRREIIVHIIQGSQKYAIQIRRSQIRSISLHTYLGQEPVIHFDFDSPPIFLHEHASINPRSAKYPLHRRLSALPMDDHARTAPFTSQSLRLVCHSTGDLHKFRMLCREARFGQKIDDTEWPISRRNLFSAEALEALHRQLRKLHWPVSFQMLALLNGRAVDPHEALTLIPQIYSLSTKKGKEFTAAFLRALRPRLEIWDTEYNMVDALEAIRVFFDECLTEFTAHYKARDTSDTANFLSYHVNITPTAILLDGPFPERSNRVVRAYGPAHYEHFLRVAFCDEGHLQYRFDRDTDAPEFLQKRVGGFLHGGLTLAHRNFRFLAYSQSALKEHAVWFVKKFQSAQHGVIDAPTIIRSLGNFHNLPSDPTLARCPARYAARISQAFTATDPTVVEVEEILYQDDIQTPSGSYTFTDGVGTISQELCRDIVTEIRSRRRRHRRAKDAPALQIRFMGSKGMLSVDYRLQGRAITLRPSMIKFDAPASRLIEVARVFDKPGDYFLNRPLIMILEGLGIEYKVFQAYQKRAVQDVQAATKSVGAAGRMLEGFGLGTSFRLASIMQALDRIGIDVFVQDQFYDDMMQDAVYHVLRDLKNHARIPIPGAWTLVGVADIHKVLKEGEIFACVKPEHGKPFYLKGRVLISRSPTIHPGDVQIARAIGTPPAGSPFSHEPLANTVVFSVQGKRPLPSVLGGGDLDGDTYNLIPLRDLPEFTPKRTFAGGEYAPAPKKLLNRTCNMEDVADFVVDYINNDRLGIIASSWLVTADQSDKHILDPDCLTLAQLHSDAVDYQKSGQSVAWERIPKQKSKTRPDWNAPETVDAEASKNFYESQRVIGRLFREIDLPDLTEKSQYASRAQRRNILSVLSGDAMDGLTNMMTNLRLSREEEQNPVITAIDDQVSRFIRVNRAVRQDSQLSEEVAGMFSRYTAELQTICSTHTLSQVPNAMLSEAEVVIGTITEKTSQPRKRKDLMARCRELSDGLVKDIREEIRGEDEEELEAALRRAWMAWNLAFKKGSAFGARSFSWVATGAIFDTIRAIEERNDEDIKRRYN